MRVGLIVYGLDRPLTGIGRYTYELIKAMAHVVPPSVEILLLCAGDPGPLKGQTSFRCVPLRGCRLLPQLLTYGNIVLRTLVKQYRLDVVHTLSGNPPFLLLDDTVTKVVTTHDVFALSIPGYSSLLDTLIYRYWLPYIYPRIHAIITISTQSQHDIQQFLAPTTTRMHIIPYGVTDTFRQFPDSLSRAYVRDRFGLNGRYLLYVGALTRRKNVERALEAFATLRRTWPDLLFVLAGPHTWKATTVESIVENFDLGDAVVMTGPLTDDDLPMLYNAAEVFVFPTLYEGFGLPLIEAMACGTPVVTSTVSSVPEVVGDAAMMIDPYDAGALAQALHQVLSDSMLRTALRERGVKRAAEFRWEHTARQTLRVYEDALGRDGSRA